MKLSLLVACAALVAAACSSSSSNSAGGDGGGSDAASNDSGMTDTGTSSDAPLAQDTSPVDASDGAAACNAITDVGQMLTVMYVASAPPTPLGGAVVDGTYALTDATIYTGVGGPTGVVTTTRSTVQITGVTTQIVTDDASGEHRATAMLVTSGTTLTATDTCPDSVVHQGSFTATATTIVAILPAGTLPDGGGPKTLVETYVKQ
jgi:hypothetical protein